jgi:hypothetical protein
VSTDVLKDLELLVRSRYGLIVLETDEDDRAAALLRHLADRLGIPFFAWSRTQGLRRDGAEGAVYATTDPRLALAHLERAAFPAIYHFRGLDAALGDADTSAHLAAAAAAFEKGSSAIVITGAAVSLPEAARARAAFVKLAGPSLDEYRSLITRTLAELSTRGPVKMELSPDETTSLVHALNGLTLLEAGKVITRAIIEDGKLSADDVRVVAGAKRAIVERDGVLEYFPAEDALADIAGLRRLKEWLARRKAAIVRPGAAAAFGLEFPRGILLVGVPGSGKSLCAKAVAGEWGLPLLKLDPSSLYNKYIGESEKNFQLAMSTADRLAPVILWIDEIEKAFASGGDADGGVSQRILGTFLNWLQERKSDVFIVATCNDVTRLPPELLRKGRFDEIFFVDLPGVEARADIFRTHLRRRGQNPARFDIVALVNATRGFSGAEIEQVIVAALYTVFAAGAPLTTQAILHEAARTRPLSVTAAERIQALRAWAQGRTVPAD